MPLDTATASARVDEINTIMARGVRRVDIDGVVVEYDFVALKQERDRLLRWLRGGSLKVGRYNTDYTA